MFSVLKGKGRGLVWTHGCDLGYVVVMWTGRRQLLCGVVVVVFLQISGGRYLKYKFENEFGQHEQKQEQEQESNGS